MDVKKLELIAEALGASLAAHDRLLDEVGWSPLDRDQLDAAAEAVFKLREAAGGEA